VTQDEFIDSYAPYPPHRIREIMRQRGWHAEPCHCGESYCQRWQMVKHDAEQEYEALVRSPAPLNEAQILRMLELADLARRQRG